METARKTPSIWWVIVGVIGTSVLYLVLASIFLSWSASTILVVGLAQTLMIGLMGPPLVNILKDKYENLTKNQYAYFTMLPFLLGGGCGILLAVASHSLNWTGTTLSVAGGALVILLGFMGPPLIMLPKEIVEAANKKALLKESPYSIRTLS